MSPWRVQARGGCEPAAGASAASYRCRGCDRRSLAGYLPGEDCRIPSAMRPLTMQCAPIADSGTAGRRDGGTAGRRDGGTAGPAGSLLGAMPVRGREGHAHLRPSPPISAQLGRGGSTHKRRQAGGCAVPLADASLPGAGGCTAFSVSETRADGLRFRDDQMPLQMGGIHADDDQTHLSDFVAQVKSG